MTSRTFRPAILLAAAIAALLDGCVNPPATVAAVVAAPKVAVAGVTQRVWNFYAVNPDCTSAGAPRLEVETPAAHGSVVVQNNIEIYTDYASTNQRYECNKKKSPGSVVEYTASKDYVGADRFTIRCIYPSGSVIEKEIRMTVTAPLAAEPSGPHE